jgi:hypothetical protein
VEIATVVQGERVLIAIAVASGRLKLQRHQAQLVNSEPRANQHRHSQVSDEEEM